MASKTEDDSLFEQADVVFTGSENFANSCCTPPAVTSQRQITASGQAADIGNAERRPEARPFKTNYAPFQKRFESFIKWPKDHMISPTELSLCGFYYAGYGDCVRCFYCGGGLCNWEDEDNVWVEHARWFPNCAYITERLGPNVTNTIELLNRDNNHVTFSMVPNEGKERIAWLVCRSESNVHFHYDQQRHRNARPCFSLDCPIITNCSRYPEYSRVEDRRKTFNFRNTRCTLALAGYFYYSRLSFCVCFHCGDIKFDFDQEDNLLLVLMQHAKTAPYCDFIRSRGLLSDGFILLAQCKNFTALVDNLAHTDHVGKNLRKAIKVESPLETNIQDILDTQVSNNFCSFCRRTPVNWQLFCCGTVSCDSCLTERRHCHCGGHFKQNHPQHIS